MGKIISSAVFIAIAGMSMNVAADSNKEKMCHNDKSISVSQQAVPAHLEHGDTMGKCDDSFSDHGKRAVVAMMRCTAKTGGDVVVVSASSSLDLSTDAAQILPFPAPDGSDVNCAEAVAGLLNNGLGLRSITSGSAGENGSLTLYSDYVFTGRVSDDS